MIPRQIDPPPLTDALVRKIGEAVFVESSLRVSDILLIFGSRQGDWRKYADFFHNGFCQKVLTTGYAGKETPPTMTPLADYSAEKLKEEGIPQSAIWIQNRSTNTLEDAAFAKDLMELKGCFPKVMTYACLAHHSGRCLLTLGKLFPKVDLAALTTDFQSGETTISSSNWWKTPLGQRTVYGEYTRILTYSQKGDILAPRSTSFDDMSVS